MFDNKAICKILFLTDVERRVENLPIINALSFASNRQMLNKNGRRNVLMTKSP